MKRVYLAQVQNRYGDNAYLPYAAGLLWAYAAAQPGILDEWELGGFFWKKEPPDEAAAKLVDPVLVGLSSYIWNWNWNLAFARAVKSRFPECKILAGGPHVPEGVPDALRDHPELDLAIYGEGEGAFADLLREWGNWEKVGSLIWQDAANICVNKRREQVDVDGLRSPYLDGTFDAILNQSPRWQVMQETNRGCVYRCSFCAWGTSSQDKLRRMPLGRVLDELDWAAARGASYIENCDANFGILPRDEGVVEHMVDLKHRTGSPDRFRAAWAKNTTDRVFSMAQKLYDAGMLKAVTLSVQSMDENVLTLVRRKNVKYDRLSDFVDKYTAAGIPTYTELILGLPGESLDTFSKGIDLLLDAGQHDGLFVYPCMILPNTEMCRPEYLQAHGIKTIKTRAMLLHAIPDPNVIEEEQDVVVETSAMCFEDWKRGMFFSWIVQALHGCGLTQVLAKRLHAGGKSYSAFYNRMLDYALTEHEDVIGMAMCVVKTKLDEALAGGSWHLVDPRFGAVSWPPEEYLFLQIACESDLFYDQLGDLLLDDLADQRRAFVPPVPGQEETYAREAVWYGRKGSGAKQRTRAA